MWLKKMLITFRQSLRRFRRRGKSMLAQPETAVVFVPGETISQGGPASAGPTAGKRPVSCSDMV